MQEKKFTGCPLRLVKLENEPFSEFGWKSWKTIRSPDLAGKAGIFIFGSNNNERHYWKKYNLIEK